MKRFAVLLCLLFAVSFMHADTIDLLGGGSGSAYVYSFPVGSWYNQTYGTGIGLVDTWTNNGQFQLEAYGGTTKGYITKFSNAYAWFYTSTYWQGLSNTAFNAKTDVFTGTFAFNGKTWHLTETFYPLNNVYTYNNGGYQYTEYSSGIKSAAMTTVPEPNTLILLGTGLLWIGKRVRAL
jgi:PEP-CTERM motif-containing protein